MYFNSLVEQMPRTDLERLQRERLQASLAHAYARVPFYRSRFDSAGVHPDDLQSLDDIRKFPFTKKSDLRETYPFGLFAVPKGDIVRLHASSGTKGKATVVGYTRHDLDVWAEIVARSIICAGGRPGDILHNAYGYGLFTGGLGLHGGAERAGITVVPASGGFTKRQITLMQDFGASGLCCTPSYALNIAETMTEMGIGKGELQLRYGIFGAEPWTEPMRARIESLLGITALDIYGLSEVMGPGVAMECKEEKRGLHVWEDHFYVEIVSPETGQPVENGEYGELVFTSLTKEALPIIRYRTGDLAALIEEPCACGRTHRRMTRVKGRVDDMLIIRGVNVFPQEVERELIGIEELAPHYQLVVTRDAALDDLEVHLEWVSHETVDEVRERHLGTHIGARLHERLHIRPARIHIHPPGTLPRSEGKAVRVVDNRNL